MVEGSLVFLPANESAFGDPRATYVFDDAKSYFWYRRERFDVIFAEPSNPWVSGTASLFTREFYARVSDFLTDGGVLGQWVQIYELDDDLFLSVLAALDATFPHYRAYLVGDADVAIVASLQPLGEPDWSVLSGERFDALTAGAPPFTPASLDVLAMFDQTTFRTVLQRGVRPNSDYHPLLDTGAERARFLRTHAEGTYSFAESRVDLGRLLSRRTLDPAPYAMVPAYGLAPAVLSGRAAWLRQALSEGGGIAPEEFPEWTEELRHLQSFLSETARDEPPASWPLWSQAFSRAEAALHWGTTGWVDSTFHRPVASFLERHDAPPEAVATVDLAHGFALGDWERAARAADLLVGRVAIGEPWTVPGALLDMAVVAYLRTDSPARARSALDRLTPRTGWSDAHLRRRLLESLVDPGAAAPPPAGGPRP